MLVIEQNALATHYLNGFAIKKMGLTEDLLPLR
jgi:hypothetical protein